jgi:Flp pilus assembly pilin Flp
MRSLVASVRSFGTDEQAATTAEYGIIVVVMAAIALAVMTTFKTSLTNLYGGANNNVDRAVTFS